MTDRLQEFVRDEVLASMLAGHPTSWVFAARPDGPFTEMPESVPLSEHRIIDGALSPVHIIVPEDRIIVVDAWTLAVEKGYAQADVRLTAAPTQPVQINFVDMTHVHGVYIGLVVSDEEPVGTPGGGKQVMLPRVGLVRKDRLAVFTEVDDATTQILGWAPEDMVGRRSLEFIHPDDHQRAISHWMDMLTSSSGARQRVRMRHQHSDGRWIWFEVTNDNRLADPEHGYVLTEMVDITDEMAAQDALRANEQLLRTLTEALPVGVIQIDAERRVVHRNARAITLLGGGNEHDGEQPPSVAGQFAAVRLADLNRLDEAMEATLRLGKELDLEVTVETADAGGHRRCALSLRPLGDAEPGQVTGAIVCVSDVTEAARLRAELTDRATFDSLTRTLNRAATIAALEGALADPRAGVGVVFVDLDQFKAVNDRRGHAAGDRLLAHAAARLVAAARKGDVVGRFGGDEFLVICPGVADERAALQVAERLATSLREPTDFDGEPLVPDASVGVAWAPAGAATADGLIARADMAMYSAKSDRTGAPVLL